MTLPKIDLFVTGRCNNHCPVCYIPLDWPSSLEIREATTTELKTTIDKLVDIGMRKLNLTGGEPLVRKDIVDIIQYAYEKGVEVYLSTNGHYLLKRYDQIATYLTWLSLSLESADPQLCKMIKEDRDQVEVITDILHYFGDHTPTHGVTIGTIVTKQNASHLVPLGQLLTSREYIPDQWKLYQYCSRGIRQNDRTRRKNVLKKEIFHDKTAGIKELYGDQIRIDTYPISKRSNRNILILPNLQLSVAIGDSYDFYDSVLDMTSTGLEQLLSGLKTCRVLKEGDNWPKGL